MLEGSHKCQEQVEEWTMTGSTSCTADGEGIRGMCYGRRKKLHQFGQSA